MAEFTTKVTGVESQTQAPKRTEVKEGTYMAMIMAANPGETSTTPPLQRLELEFQIIHEDNKEKSRDFAGRRVWQHFVTESEDPELAQVRAYQLRLLLLAAGVKFTSTDDGRCAFNTDHLVSKTVKITVIHKPKKGDDGKPRKDENGNPMFFVNVRKVEPPDEIKEEELL